MSLAPRSRAGWEDERVPDRSTSDQRLLVVNADELAALCSPAARQAVERNGFTLGTYADLAARR